MALFQWGSRVSTRMGSTVWSRMGPVSRLEWTLPPSHRIVLWLTICWTCLQLLPTARLVPLKYHTMQTAPSYAGTMNSPVTWESHTGNATRFNNWWRVQIWAGLLRPRPYVHWALKLVSHQHGSANIRCNMASCPVLNVIQFSKYPLCQSLWRSDVDMLSYQVF